jgi:hypothetical protein
MAIRMQPIFIISKRDRSVVADAPGRPPLRRNGKHDETQRKHLQSHEFEYQRVHGNPP